MKMKILEIEIIKTKSETVLGRADIHFEGFWVKGFKVLQDRETKKEYVTPPSYQAGNFWRPIFKTDNSDDWEELTFKVIRKFDESQMKEAADEIKEDK